MTRSLLLLALTGAWGMSCLSAVQADVARAPNFIIIFCDDMGYADIGPFGAQGYQTPHLDRMAREGHEASPTSMSAGRSARPRARP